MQQTLAVEWVVLKSSVNLNMALLQNATFAHTLVFALLELPQSTVSAMIAKWKHLGAPTFQPKSGRTRKLTEQGCHVLKYILC